MDISKWKSKGQFKLINGHRIFFIDQGTSDTTLLILHGFPSSSYDFYHVFDQLCQKYRVIIHDHLGFGFSDKPKNYSYSLIDQTHLALALWKSLGVERAHILGHDYGTSIITELVAMENENQLKIKALSYTLCNGSMLIRMAKLLPIQKLLRSKLLGNVIARLSNKFIFTRNLNKIWYDRSKLLKDDIDNLWELLINNDGKGVISKISRYTFEREKLWDRWIGGLECSKSNFYIVWAENDPIAVHAMALRLNKICKNSKLLTIKKTGHYPMIENPEIWVQAILSNPY